MEERSTHDRRRSGQRGRGRLGGKDEALKRRKQNKNSANSINTSLGEKQGGIVSRETRRDTILKRQNKNELSEIENIATEFFKFARAGK